MSSAQTKAYTIIRQRLVSGHYSPGEALREEALAQELGVSRTPVRAALRRLVDDGLATTELGHGVHVHEWGERDLWEIYRIRLKLEPLCLELALQNNREAVIAGLTQANAAMAQAFAAGGSDMAEAVQQANRAFHRVALDHSGAPRIRTILQTLTEMPVIFGSFFVYSNAEIAQSISHHGDIVTAARTGAPDLAAGALEHHLRMSFAALVAHRSQAPSAQAGAETEA